MPTQGNAPEGLAVRLGRSNAWIWAQKVQVSTSAFFSPLPSASPGSLSFPSTPSLRICHGPQRLSAIQGASSLDSNERTLYSDNTQRQVKRFSPRSPCSPMALPYVNPWRHLWDQQGRKALQLGSSPPTHLIQKWGGAKFLKRKWGSVEQGSGQSLPERPTTTVQYTVHT